MLSVELVGLRAHAIDFDAFIGQFDSRRQSASQQETALPSNLRPITRECVLLVTRGHFRSRDKDGGYTIRSAISKNPMLHANFMALFCRTGVIANGSFTFRKKDLIWLFRSCDLDLDPMTFIYELDPYCLEIYRMC